MLQADQDQYRFLFDSMPQGAFYLLADGTVADVNPAALELLGVTDDYFKSTIADSSSWQPVTEDGTALPRELWPMNVALRTGQPVRDFVAGVYNGEQQRQVWLNVSAIPMYRDGEGTPYQVLVILHDISRQKRMNDLYRSRIHLMQFANDHPVEELLVEALDELELLTGSAIGFFHFFDEVSGMVSLKAWSSGTAAEFCHIPEKTGHYSIKQAGVWVECLFTGEPVIHNDYANLPHRRGLPAGHAPVTRELVVPVKRKGRAVAVLGVGNKTTEYTEADVEAVSLFADLVWDIAERKQAETALLQAGRQLEILTSTAMDGYWVISSGGSVVSANETSCRMHGYARGELLGKSVHDICALHPSGFTNHLASMKKEGYRRFECRHNCKDGRIIDIEVSAALIPESGDILVFMRDITEQKQMQRELLRRKEELKQANELLEQRVNQRTADLQAAIREHESFSYSVSHDLRAPLRHINSFSAMLQEDYGDEIPPGAREYLDRIRAASSQMGSLIDHLLEMSRVTRARLELAPVDLSELAAATLRMYEETEPHRQVEISIEPRIAAMGDRHLLNQLLANLLGNAWKYTARRSPARIEFGRKLDSGEEAYFVRDNGAGFDMAYSRNLFRAFERLHGAEFEGIGIGLATAQRIVQRHGGRIWGEGAPEQGAIFYFTLAGSGAHDIEPGETAQPGGGAGR